VELSKFFDALLSLKTVIPVYLESRLYDYMKEKMAKYWGFFCWYTSGNILVSYPPNIFLFPWSRFLWFILL